MEPEFGLLQLGVRFYDAEVGRFTRRDPTGYGNDPYTYVEGRPLFFIDPVGLSPTLPDMDAYYACSHILEDINEAIRELRKRFKEMLEDKYKLYDLYCEDSKARDPFGNGNWVGHQEQYCDWQYRLIDLSRAWAKNKCWCHGFRLPEHGMCLKSNGPPQVNEDHLGKKPCTPKQGPISKYRNGCPKRKK